MWVKESCEVMVHMSITGSIVIIFVLLARMLLHKAPKIFSYFLWMIVLFRLLCPVSFTSEWSLLPKEVMMPEDVVESEIGETIQGNVLSQSENRYQEREQGMEALISVAGSKEESATKKVVQDIDVRALLSVVWLLGVGVFGCYSVWHTQKLRKSLCCAVLIRDNVFQCDYIDTPFIWGVLKPRIYLPSELVEAERNYIIAHEQHHLRRGDHIWKLTAHIALGLHWFNPLVWLSFGLMGKDMEMSCDEAVLDGAGEDIRQAYSTSLLRLSTGRRKLSLAPLAFGEGEVKKRIRNIMNYNRPSFWIILLCTVVCVGLGISLSANPKQEDDPPSDSSKEIPATSGGAEDLTEEALLQYVTVWEKNVDYNGDGTEDIISFVIQLDGDYEEFIGVTDGDELLRAAFIGMVQCMDGATGEFNFTSGTIAHARPANRQISYAEIDGSHYMISTEIHEQMGDGYYVYVVYSLTEQELVDSYEIYFVTSGDDFHARPTAKYRQEVVPEFQRRLEKWTEDAVLIVATDVNERAEDGIFVSSMTQSYAACYYYDLVWERMLDEKVRVDSFGPRVNLPKEAWIQNPQYLLSDYPVAHIKYYDGLAKAPLLLRYGEMEPMELSYLYDITFEEEQECCYPVASQDEEVVIRCQVSSMASSEEKKTVLVSWFYEELNYVIFGELKKDADIESLIQTAGYVIENYE